MLLCDTLNELISSLLWDFLKAVDGVIYKAGLICLVVVTSLIISRKKKKEKRAVTIESQVKVRERARCSLCQSWQIGQLPVRCGEEGRRGRRGRL